MNNVKSFPPEWNEYDTNKFVNVDGGGSDPIVENAKQTGGFGYTEQGNQTVITWDGNTEGHYIVNINNLNNVHVSNKTPASIIGGSFTHSGETFDIKDNNVVLSGEWGYMLQLSKSSVVTCIFNDNTTIDATGATYEKKGIYFASLNGYISSLTYGTPDTVHKIDEKYLPVILAAPSADGTYTLTCTVTNGNPAYSWKSAT